MIHFSKMVEGGEHGGRDSDWNWTPTNYTLFCRFDFGTK